MGRHRKSAHSILWDYAYIGAWPFVGAMLTFAGQIVL